MAKKSNRGGSGRGQGRHPITPGENKVRRFPMVRPSIWKYIERKGEGNASAGIEIIVEILRRSELMERLGGKGIHTDDTYDGVCPKCKGFAVFWQPDVEEYIKNPSAKWACENGHAR